MANRTTGPGRSKHCWPCRPRGHRQPRWWWLEVLSPGQRLEPGTAKRRSPWCHPDRCTSWGRLQHNPLSGDDDSMAATLSKTFPFIFVFFIVIESTSSNLLTGQSRRTLDQVWQRGAWKAQETKGWRERSGHWTFSQYTELGTDVSADTFTNNLGLSGTWKVWSFGPVKNEI